MGTKRTLTQDQLQQVAVLIRRGMHHRIAIRQVLTGSQTLHFGNQQMTSRLAATIRHYERTNGITDGYRAQ